MFLIMYIKSLDYTKMQTKMEFLVSGGLKNEGNYVQFRDTNRAILKIKASSESNDSVFKCQKSLK